MADAGHRGDTIYNGFDVDEPPGDRAATRAALGVADDERLLVHPVRAIERKDVPAALDAGRGARRHLLARRSRPRTATTTTLAALLAPRRVPGDPPAVARDDGRRLRGRDAVAFPSTWEGFGNPPDRGGHPPAAGRGRRLPGGRRAPRARASGGSTPTGPAELDAFLREPDPALHDHNAAVRARAPRPRPARRGPRAPPGRLGPVSAEPPVDPGAASGGPASPAGSSLGQRVGLRALPRRHRAVRRRVRRRLRRRGRHRRSSAASSSARSCSRRPSCSATP